MRMSQLATTTLRETPGDTDLISHALLVRAGYVKQHSAGIYSLLPLGLAAIRKICDIIRDEMNRIGGQELLMPVSVTADLWKETGRYYSIREELLRFKDRNEKDMVLCMTHEEVVTDVMRRFLKSYRQLPVMLYQIQTKYRDEARPRGGLIRLREFMMKDGYSFHTDAEDLDRYYREVYDAYLRIYRRCGLPVVVVQSDPGMMGGRVAHEYMAVTPGGEDTLILCPSCGYAANREIAVCHHPSPDVPPEKLSQVQVAGAQAPYEVAQRLGVPLGRLVNALGYRTAAGERVVLCVAGDREISIVKAQNLVGAELIPDAPSEAASPGTPLSPFAASAGEPGERPRVIVDSGIAGEVSLACPSGQPGAYFVNVYWHRDLPSVEVGDVALVVAGEMCPECHGPLESVRAIEVGNIFKLGDKYSSAMGCTFADEHGDQLPAVMGCYGIGVGRILAALVEIFHDDRGMSLPISVAPYEVSLLALDGHTNEEVRSAAERAYEAFERAGVSVLYDDRPVSAGVKFKDADLLGMPIQATLGARGLKTGQAEIKLRGDGAVTAVPTGGLVDAVLETREALRGPLACCGPMLVGAGR